MYLLSQFNILCVTDMVVVARFHGKYVAQHGRVYDSRRRSSGTITLSGCWGRRCLSGKTSSL